MATSSALSHIKEFECDKNDEKYTHIIESTKYKVPSRHLASFYSNIESIIGLGKREVKERVPDLTPAFFNLLVPVDERVTPDEAISSLAQIGMEAVLSVEYKTENVENSKICIVFRSPPHTKNEEEVESLLFLYPRLLIKREPERKENNSLTIIRTRLIRDFGELNRQSGNLVDWEIKNILHNKSPKDIQVYGSCSSNSIKRSYYKCYDDRGEEIDIDSVFDQKERSLSPSYLYSLNRLARRFERAKELSPELQALDELLKMISPERKEEPSDVLAISQAIYCASEGRQEGELLLEDFLEGVIEKTEEDRDIDKEDNTEEDKDDTNNEERENKNTNKEKKNRLYSDGSITKKKEKYTAHELWCEVALLKPRYTTMTLRYMASRDNPILFKKAVENEIKGYLWRSIGPHGSSLDISQVLKSMYGHLFAFEDKEEEWYYYKETHWEENGDKQLREKLRTDIMKIYEKLYDQVLLIARNDAQNEAQSKAYKERAKKCSGIIIKLGSKEKNAIISEASDLFSISDLYQKLDGPISFNTFAFADCVYNLVPDNPEESNYSDGRPQDFCRRSSPLMMKNNNYSINHPDVKMLMDYLRQVLCNYNEEDEPDESVMWYMIDRVAVAIEGGNRLKHLTISSGPHASNSKSTFESIVHDGMGGYSATINTAKVVSKSRGDGDAATPALRHLAGCRCAWIKETSKGDKINAGQILEMTSGLDPIACRDLYSKRTVEIIPSYKMFFFVNNTPTMSADEPGLWIRVRLVLWLSQFVEDAPSDEKEQRKERRYSIDPLFAKKRIAMVAPMMWLLCERYKVCGKYGPKEPPAVLEYVKAYRKSNDVFGRFLGDCVEDADGSSIDIDSLYTDFVRWWRTRHQHATYYSLDDLQAYVTKTYGQPKWNTTWEGYRIRPRLQRAAGY